MRKMRKVSAAVLVAAILVCFVMYFVTRTPRSESPRMAAVEPQVAAGELVDAADVTSVAKEPPVGVAVAHGTKVLRVILEGVTEEDARMATVTLTAVDTRTPSTAEIRPSWPCQELTSEFDLDPFFASVERHENVRADELEVHVDHPLHLSETTRVPLSRGVKLKSGQTVYEVRVRLAEVVFWPELTLAVRDVHTRAHLEDVELRILPGALNASWGRNYTSTLLGDGLRSPIALMGGREADEPEVTVAGVALLPAAGESPRLVELAPRLPLERGVIVSARAPGYAWGSIVLDVSQGDRELLLEPAAQLGVRLANVQLERYAALETEPMLCVYWIRADGGNQYVHFEPLDEPLETEGLRLDSLRPGGYRVTVELGGGSWTKQPVLAREELSGELALAAGDTRELVLTLADPPAPPERATLGGVVSLPAFGGEEKVRLQLYFQTTQRWRDPDVELSLADLQRVRGALPSWSFRAEDLPVGLYRVQLLPFLKVWMIELPAGGREDVELVLPELAEVLVETVDKRTGERVPLDEFHYRRQKALPRQVQNDRARADTEEPGRFRFWTAPGAVSIWPRGQGRLGYGRAWMDLELIPGLQSVRFELAPVCAMHFEFREGGAALPIGYKGLRAMQDIRAVDHEGRVQSDGFQTDNIVEVSAPGVYEINFEGLTADRYHPIPPRRVDVRAGETTEVIVELRRK